MYIDIPAMSVTANKLLNINNNTIDQIRQHLQRTIFDRTKSSTILPILVSIFKIDTLNSIPS